MSIHSDIRTDQYKTTENLNKRANLHRRFNTNPQPWNKWIFSQLPLKRGNQVLDIGCGTGVLWQENRNRLSENIKLALTDRSFAMARTSKATLESQAGFRFSQTDAQTLPFADNTFDLITANHVIFFIPNIHQALNEMKRVLRPGGWLTATTNGKNHMQELYDLVAQVKDASIGVLFGGDDRGPKRFTLENGAQMLNKTFGQDEKILFPANLKVTETQPLMDYIETLWQLNETEQNTLQKLIDAEIQQQGYFFIAKVQGLLLAQKPISEEANVDLM